MPKPDWLKKMESEGTVKRCNPEFFKDALVREVDMLATAATEMVNFEELVGKHPELIAEETFQKMFEVMTLHLGWLTYHQRPARTKHGYLTAVSGTGKGMVDNVCVRERVVWVELKSEDGDTTPEQDFLIERLRAIGEEVYVWRPSQWKDMIATMSKMEKS